MAEDRRMTAAQFADKLMSSEHADVVRESVAFVVAEPMEAEVAAQIGAGHGEVTPERVTQRNGSRPRVWATRAGEIELAIPKLRSGSYFPSFFEPGDAPSRRSWPSSRRPTSTGSPHARSIAWSSSSAFRDSPRTRSRGCAAASTTRCGSSASVRSRASETSTDIHCEHETGTISFHRVQRRAVTGRPLA